MDNAEEFAAEDVGQQAVRSLLNQVPTTPDTPAPQTAAQQQQPWADIAATPGTDKKPLELLVEEYERKVAANPTATIPPSPFPAPSVAYMETFSRPAKPAGRKRRRRKRGPRSGAAGETPSTASPVRRPPTNSGDGSAAPTNPARRRRRRRGGRGGGSGPRPSGPPA